MCLVFLLCKLETDNYAREIIVPSVYTNSGTLLCSLPLIQWDGYPIQPGREQAQDQQFYVIYEARGFRPQLRNSELLLIRKTQ